MLTVGQSQPFSPNDQVLTMQPVNALQHVQSIWTNNEVEMQYKLYTQVPKASTALSNIPGAQRIWRHP